MPHRWQPVATAALLYLAACDSQDDFRVTIAVSPELSAPQAERLVVFVGAAKSSWPELKAGDQVSVSLSPGNTEPELTVVFWLAGAETQYRALPYEGSAGHRVLLQVDELGRVHEERCRRPCAPLSVTRW
jgi:hypothetical protein